MAVILQLCKLDLNEGVCPPPKNITNCFKKRVPVPNFVSLYLNVHLRDYNMDYSMSVCVEGYCTLTKLATEM